MSTGLTLGKYAPLHKGHEKIFEWMIAENEQNIVIIYDSNVTEIPLPIRSNWIKTLYPSMKVIEAWDGPKRNTDIHAYEKAEENYVKGLLKGTKIDSFYSSEYYGKHISEALGCKDVRFDEKRKNVSISASEIRNDPFANRMFMDDIVYADIITKIVFVGAMSTGKSTIAEVLAKKYNTQFMPEYGREYWELHQKNRRFDINAFDELADEHIRREDKLVQVSNKYLFIDTNAITTYMFSMDYHGNTTKHLAELAAMNASRYDLFFLCDDDIPYEDTWDRSGDSKRHVFQKQIIADMKERRIPYITLSGDLQKRVNTVDHILKSFKKYGNYFGGINAENGYRNI
jgi:NadR type nicotinamide-nucleotide adenylyltransferase